MSSPGHPAGAKGEKLAKWWHAFLPASCRAASQAKAELDETNLRVEFAHCVAG